ncbi:MAG: DUF4169 family protein [Boseongicola sp.]
MKGPPINLNRARKIRARKAAKTKSDSNAIKFGIPKSEKIRVEQVTKRATSHLEGHKKADT